MSEAITVVEVRQTFDAAALTRMARTPGVFEGITDFRFPTPERFKIEDLDLDRNVALEFVVDGKEAGFALIGQFTGNSAQYHGAILPEFRKRYWRRIGEGLFELIFNGWGLPKLVAFCPQSNGGGNAFNSRMGMKVEGFIEGAHQYPGKPPEGVIAYGLTKEQWNAGRRRGN